MRRKTYATVMTLALSVAVILAFATTPASANSMQGTGKSDGSVSTPAMRSGAGVGVITEPHQDAFFDGEAGATAERDRRFSAKSPLRRDRGDTMAGVITEPHQDVFYVGEAGANAERDRRFSYQSRLLNRLTRVGATTAPVDVQPQPGAFFNGEAGATAERDRRASAVTRAEQRGLMRVEGVPELIISGEPLVEWYEPFAQSAGSGWGQAAGAGSSSYRGRRAGAPVHVYEVNPYPYDYWFAPITGE
jgi:hypothetical protein